MKQLIFIIALLLTGCANMGVTEYELEPIKLDDGTVICCKATVYNSKDYEGLKFKFKADKDGNIEAVLDEKGVNSSDPAFVAAENNKKLLDVVSKLIPLTGG